MKLINLTKEMILTPGTKWAMIANEEPNPRKIIINYVLPLTRAAAAAAFVGYGIFGYGLFITNTSNITWGLYYAIAVLVKYLSGILLITFAVDALAPSFNSGKNFGRSLQWIAIVSLRRIIDFIR